MTIDPQLDALLKLFGAAPTTLRQFVDANLMPQAKFHQQALRFTKAVDSVFNAKNSLDDWMRGHISMDKRHLDPAYDKEKVPLADAQAEFTEALLDVLEGFKTWRQEGGDHGKR